MRINVDPKQLEILGGEPPDGTVVAFGKKVFIRDDKAAGNIFNAWMHQLPTDRWYRVGHPDLAPETWGRFNYDVKVKKLKVISVFRPDEQAT